MTYYEHHVMMTLRLGRWAEQGIRDHGPFAARNGISGCHRYHRVRPVRRARSKRVWPIMRIGPLRALIRRPAWRA